MGDRVRSAIGAVPVWPLAALGALVALNLVFTPGFGVVVRDGRLYGAVVDIVLNGAPVILLAIGMTLVIATGGIDLGVGSVMALSGAAAALALVEHGAGPTAAIAVGLGIGASCGAVSGALVAWFGLQPIVATLVMLVSARGVAQALTGDQKVRMGAGGFEFLASGNVLGVPTPVAVVIVAAAVVMAALRWTVLGLDVRAVGASASAARLAGRPVARTRLIAYVVSGVCAGLAGLIAAAEIREADVANSGLYLELDAILAVVIGGTSLSGGRPRVAGSVIGAMFMQALTITLLMHDVRTEHTLVVKAGVALGVCAVQSPAAAVWWSARRARRAALGEGR